MMRSWNLPSVFESDEKMRQDIKACMAKVFEKATHQKCVIFKAFAFDMLRGYMASGKDFPGEKSSEEELWDVLKKRAPFSRSAYRKARLCLFQDTTRAAEANFDQWWLDCLERTTLALDAVFLKGKGLLG